MTVIVGDLHGTPESLLDIAAGLGLINSSYDWSAAGAELVLTGDACDRGHDSASLYRLIMRWQRAAPGFGSRVTFLIGNHELMNMQGLTYYNSPGETAGYAGTTGGSGVAARSAAFAPGGWVYDWLIKQPFIIRTGPFVVSHADFQASLRDLSVQQINSFAGGIFHPKEETENDREEPSGTEGGVLDFTEKLLWSREAGEHRFGYGLALDRFLKQNVAEYWVCGHTPSPDGRIRTAFSGRYICVDTGMFLGGRNSAVVYDRGIIEAFYSDGESGIRREPI